MAEKDDKTIEYFHKVYQALHRLETKDPYLVPAIASLRLLLIDAVGEEKQSELIGQWNEEIEILKSITQEVLDKDSDTGKPTDRKKSGSYLKGYA